LGSISKELQAIRSLMNRMEAAPTDLSSKRDGFDQSPAAA